jgi:hypothetical protein
MNLFKCRVVLYVEKTEHNARSTLQSEHTASLPTFHGRRGIIQGLSAQ